MSQKMSLVLVPCDEQFESQLRRIVHNCFASYSKKYLLGANSLAHISLIQFETMHYSDIQFRPKPSFNELVFKSWRFKPLAYEHPRLWAAEFIVSPCQELQNLHEVWLEIIKAHQLKVCNKAGINYAPHLTLAYVTKPDITSSDLDACLNRAFAFELKLGCNDSIWQLSDCIS